MSEEYVVSKDTASRMNPFAPDHTNEPIETMDFSNINTVGGKNLANVNINPGVQAGQPNPNPTTNINTVDGKNLADVNVNPHVNEWVSTNDTVITNTNAPKGKEFIDSLLKPNT